VRLIDTLRLDAPDTRRLDAPDTRLAAPDAVGSPRP
jgi:hypothetical protein